MNRILLALVLAVAAASAPAQEYPSRPVKVIVPYTAGGSSDFVARTVATRLAERLKQSVIVENKPGGAAQIGTESVAKSPPDGYTLLLMGMSTHVIAPALYKKLPYDAVKDFTPVARVVESPVVAVVHPDVPARNLREFAEWARANPGKINYGSAGVGNTLHLAGEFFAIAAGVQMTHVPYKGASQAVTDLLGGRIQVMFDLPQTPMSYIQAGKLRALAVTGNERLAVLPNVPTAGEAGLPGFRYATWIGLAAPAGTPAAVVARLNAEVGKVMAEPEVREAFAKMAMTVPPIESPEALASRIRTDIEGMKKLIQDAHIPLQ